MNNKKRVEKINDKEYQEIFGIKRVTFEKMLEILENEYIELHKQGGSKPKLSVLDKLIVTLGYYREYRSMKHIAFDYGVVKSTICDSIKWVENTLIKDGTFSLPSKKVLTKATSKIEVVLVDVTECEIERPQKNKRNGIQVKRKNTQ